MTSIDDLLTTAEKQPPRHHDVELYVGDDTSDRIAALETQIEEVEKDVRFGDPRKQQLRDQIAAIEAEAAGNVFIIRFRALPAEDWADITGRSPARLDVPVDRMYGYNVHDAARAAAPLSGVHLVVAPDADATEEQLTEEQWERLFKLLSGRDFGRITDAIFDLNDYGPQQRLDAARKASRAGSGTTSS